MRSANSIPSSRLVSHDRYLLGACADRLWLVGGGTVAPFDGDLDDYRTLVLSGARDTDGAGKPGERSSRSEARRFAAERRAELAPLKRRIGALETEMAGLGKRIAEIDQMLADPKLYERDPARVAVLAKERADAAAGLAAAEEQWLALSGEYESAEVARREAGGGTMFPPPDFEAGASTWYANVAGSCIAARGPRAYSLASLTRYGIPV
jgi:ATP-binding cassette, subfamily F, member 3